VRMVELDGKPQQDVQVSFASPITEAREVNGQEQPVGPATVSSGALETYFGAYQPRTFALRLAPPAQTAAPVRSATVTLAYDAVTASKDGERSAVGFDGKGNALPAEMLPGEIMFNGVKFQLAPVKAGGRNALIARGQIIKLPEGEFNRVYVLAASADGDQKATFEVGTGKADVDIQDWSGFIGQWDDRQWGGTKLDVDHANYGQMTGLKQGFIKRADLAWYSDHHLDATGKNVTYSYSYLFGYPLDLPPGARTLKLPKNDKIRILAISVAEEGPAVSPAHPLYDVLPSPNASPGVIAYVNSPAASTNSR
jgi:alpha-mannosidase